jgi:putative phosphoribosyl transferase
MKTSPSQCAEYDVAIPCGETTLQGDLNVPSRAKGLVIFAHGSGSSRNSPRNQAVARELNRKGLATLLFDLLAPDEAAADAITGAFRFDIPILTSRLIAATRWARKEDALHRLSIGFFGASTGAAAALVAATKLPEVAAVVSRGGRSDLAGDAVTRVKAATLLIAGENDEPVVEWNQTTFRKLNCTKQLAVVGGASHLFSEPGALEEVAALAAAWFSEHLGAATRNSNGPRT